MWTNIQKVLDQRKISIYKLSKLTGIANSLLYSYKNDHVEPSFKNVVKIAEVLNISLDKLK